MSVASPPPISPAHMATYRAASGSMSRSPKRAKSSPSPHEAPLRSSQSSTNSGRSRSRASVPNRRLEQGSYGSLASQDPVSEGRHAVTSPARGPEQSKTPWSPAQSRRREMSVPLLSQTLSSCSLSQISPPEMSTSHPSRPNPRHTPQSSSLTQSSSSSADLSTFTPRRPVRFMASGASSPASASKRHVHPATAPLPHISAFLGSPFSSRTARGDYVYDPCSPLNNHFRASYSERIPHDEHGVPSHDHLWHETSEWMDDVGHDHAEPSRTHRRRDMSGSSSSIESYTNSGASSASLPSLGRNSMEQGARPGIVTIREMYGEEEEYTNEDEASTPCRTLFSDGSEGRAVSTTSITAVDTLTSPLAPKRASSKSPVQQPISPLQSFFSHRTPSSKTGREKTSPGSRPRSPFASLIPRLLSSRKSKTPPVPPLSLCNGLCDKAAEFPHGLGYTTSRKFTSQSGPAEVNPMIGLGIDTGSKPRGTTSPFKSRTPAPFMLRTFSGDSSSEPEPSPSRPLSARASVAKLDPHSPTSPGRHRDVLSLNRRRTTVGRVQGRKSPTKATEGQGKASRPSLRRGVTEPRTALSRSTSSVRHLFPNPVHTPPALFDHIKPSPAAFASTGLVKKRSGIAPIEIPTFRSDTDRPAAHSPQQADISPISPLSPSRPGRPGQLPRTKLNMSSQASSSKSVVTSTSASGESVLQAAQRNRGLRRKGSQMFGHHSSSSIGDVSRLDLSTSPATPTKGFPTRPSLSNTVTTPSPGSNGHFQYPFTVSKNKDLATPSPDKSKSQVQVDVIAPSRMSQLRRGPVARASNPMLAATFKADLLTTPPESSSALTFKLNGKEVALPQADKFNKEFVVVQLLGSGAFSQVWKVKHKGEGTVWAVKAGKPYTGMKNRLRQLEEVSILRQLSLEPHPSIIRFVDSWEQHSRLYQRTELAASGDLARFLEALGDFGGLGEARAWKTLVELSGGLAHIHANNFLHLDLKPSNVLIASDGSLRIADFGMSVISGTNGHAEALSPALPTPDGDGAFVWSDRSDKTMSLVPSPILDRDIEGDREYLSPEALADGPMGREADVYSLGILLLEAALNVVLPPNGEGWVKLRTDDFSDLSEHYRSAESAVEAPEAEEGLPVISATFLDLVKGMMASDPTKRTTLATVEGHRAVQMAGRLVREGDGEGRRGGKALVEEEAWFLPRVLGEA